LPGYYHFRRLRLVFAWLHFPFSCPPRPAARPTPTRTPSAPLPPLDASPASAPDQAEAALLPPASTAPPLGMALFEPSDRRGRQLLEQLAPRRGREALAWLRKALKDALRAEKAAPAVRPKLGAGVTAGDLEALVAGLLAAPGDLEGGSGGVAGLLAFCASLGRRWLRLPMPSGSRVLLPGGTTR
jgi:hypothetical protein